MIDIEIDMMVIETVIEMAIFIVIGTVPVPNWGRQQGNSRCGKDKDNKD
jgi:hypothetical protein